MAYVCTIEPSLHTNFDIQNMQMTINNIIAVD